MTLQTPPVARTQMLIRRPAADVYDAFVDPAITTKFWFTKASGRLEPGALVRWDWEMYGVHADVRVLDMQPEERILVDWDQPPTTVEWTFTEREDGATLVSIANWGFHGTDDQQVAQALDSMGGFTFVLCGLKAWLEHGLTLGLVADHHPDAHV